MMLTEDLMRSEDGSAGWIQHCTALAVQHATAMSAAHPDQPDYVRALADALFTRGCVYPGETDSAADLDRAADLLATLAQQNPLPWRVEAANRMRTKVDQMRAAGAPEGGA
jgi:hypothetical protein